jgi:hypothetical protein
MMVGIPNGKAKKWDGESTELRQMWLRVRHGARALKYGSSMTTRRPSRGTFGGTVHDKKGPLVQAYNVSVQTIKGTTDIICRADGQSPDRPRTHSAMIHT